MKNGEYQREDVCPFFGGFILKIDNEDKYFPQCCGDISDIEYWGKISEGIIAPNEGHPSPILKINSKNVMFDFTVGEYDEYFEPTPPNKQLEVGIVELKLAVQKTISELNRLSNRIIRLNQELDLGIEKIDDLLVWSNRNN